MKFVVLLSTGRSEELPFPYGPFDDMAEAEDFAAFVAKEIDPASVVPLRSPSKELLAWWRTHRDELPAAVTPEHWPPRPGQVWQDGESNRWVCAGTNASNTPYLVCIAYQADDSAEEIWRLHGPMTLVHSFAPTEEECPF